MVTSKDLKELSKWMNAATEAWNQGIGEWVYQNGQSVLVEVWSDAYLAFGAESAGLKAVTEYCIAHGLELHKGKLKVTKKETT